MPEGAAVPVVVLGTEHLSDWDGQDGRPDILAADRQAQVADVVSALASFGPSKVALEVLASRQPQLDEAYGRYVQGAAEPSRTELEQIGFRLAREAGATVHAVDADWTLAHGPMEEHFAAHPEERLSEGLGQEGAALSTAIRAARQELSLREFLRLLNEPPAVSLNDREYLDRWLPIGAGSSWAGVELVASWYRRNLRIFANLQRVAADDDRLVLVIGSGHAPSLAHFLQVSGRFDLVQVSAIL